MKLFPGVPTYQRIMMLGAFGAVALYSLSQQKERVQEITKLKLVDVHPLIIDGDTVGLGNARIRIVGIDAPDEDVPAMKQVSRLALSALATRDGGLECSTSVFDYALRRENQCNTSPESYGRLNLACRFQANKASVAATMVAQGYAVDYRVYSGGAYVDLMRSAAQRRLGLWESDYDAMRKLAVLRAQLPKSCDVDTIRK